MRKITRLTLATLTCSFFAVAPSMADDGMVDGVVKELRPGGELTIKHGPLPKLDMPAMTMVFKTSEPSMAKGLKVGDKIKMQVEVKGGKLTIMKLEK